MAFLANGWAVGITFIIGVVFLCIGLWLMLKEDSNRIGGLVCLALALVFGIAWQFAATHRVVPPNTRWVIINTATGQPDGEIRKPGLTTKPFILYEILAYPGVPDQQFCYDITPALKEGYELKITICGTYDAGSVDWTRMYQQYNFQNEGAMLAYWANQTKELVSAALKEVDYSKIVSDRPGVAESIKANIEPWITSFGAPVSNLRFQNWNPTSEKVQSLMDDASSASLRKTVELQLLAAAQTARERQLYEVQTSNMVLAERGKGLEILFSSLSITDDNAKAYLASQMTWYTLAQNPPAGTQLILSFGGGSSVAAPFSIQQPAVPTPAPKP